MKRRRTLQDNMAIFIEKPTGYCDPNSELIKYYEDSYRKIKEANERLANTIFILQDRISELDEQAFYAGNQELLQVKKENAKLKKSLRKLYEKYIKPYQNHGDDPYTTKDTLLEGLNYIDPKGNFQTIRLHKGNV